MYKGKISQYETSLLGVFAALLLLVVKSFMFRY